MQCYLQILRYQKLVSVVYDHHINITKQINLYPVLYFSFINRSQKILINRLMIIRFKQYLLTFYLS